MPQLGALFSGISSAPGLVQGQGVGNNPTLAQNGFKFGAQNYGTGPGQIQTNQYGQSIDAAQQNALGTNSNQNSLIAELQAEAEGKGSNLANAQLQQGLQQSNAATQAQLSSARGINPGSAAREIVQQQGATNAGMSQQAAINRMQQEMQARQLLGSTLAQQQAGNLGLLGQAGALQQGQNTTALQGLGLNQATDSQNAGLQFGTQQLNAGVGQNAQQMGAQELGGLAGLGASVATGFLARGGPVKPLKMGSGGVNTLLSPDEEVVSPEAARRPDAPALAARLVARGANRVPGKAKVPGDDEANDTQPADLPEGAVVLPRSVTLAKDAPAAAAKFMAQVLARKAAEHHAFGESVGFDPGLNLTSPTLGGGAGDAFGLGLSNPVGPTTASPSSMGLSSTTDAANNAFTSPSTPTPGDTLNGKRAKLALAAGLQNLSGALNRPLAPVTQFMTPTMMAKGGPVSGGPDSAHARLLMHQRDSTRRAAALSALRGKK